MQTRLLNEITGAPMKEAAANAVESALQMINSMKLQTTSSDAEEKVVGEVSPARDQMLRDQEYRESLKKSLQGQITKTVKDFDQAEAKPQELNKTYESGSNSEYSDEETDHEAWWKERMKKIEEEQAEEESDTAEQAEKRKETNAKVDKVKTIVGGMVGVADATKTFINKHRKVSERETDMQHSRYTRHIVDYGKDLASIVISYASPTMLTSLALGSATTMVAEFVNESTLSTVFHKAVKHVIDTSVFNKLKIPKLPEFISPSPYEMLTGVKTQVLDELEERHAIGKTYYREILERIDSIHEALSSNDSSKLGVLNDNIKQITEFQSNMIKQREKLAKYAQIHPSHAEDIDVGISSLNKMIAYNAEKLTEAIERISQMEDMRLLDSQTNLPTNDSSVGTSPKEEALSFYTGVVKNVRSSLSRLKPSDDEPGQLVLPSDEEEDKAGVTEDSSSKLSIAEKIIGSFKSSLERIRASQYEPGQFDLHSDDSLSDDGQEEPSSRTSNNDDIEKDEDKDEDEVKKAEDNMNRYGGYW